MSALEVLNFAELVRLLNEDGDLRTIFSTMLKIKTGHLLEIARIVKLPVSVVKAKLEKLEGLHFVKRQEAQEPRVFGSDDVYYYLSRSAFRYENDLREVLRSMPSESSA